METQSSIQEKGVNQLERVVRPHMDQTRPPAPALFMIGNEKEAQPISKVTHHRSEATPSRRIRRVHEDPWVEEVNCLKTSQATHNRLEDPRGSLLDEIGVNWPPF